jgi:hypothetical protein
MKSEKLKYEFPRLDIQVLNLPSLIEATSSTSHVMIRGLFQRCPKGGMVEMAIGKP